MPIREVNRETWPLDYRKVFQERIKLVHKLRTDPEAKAIAMAHYANNPADWITDFMITIDPRAEVKIFPFIMFPRQLELVDEMHRAMLDQQSILVEKCRDAGVSWIAIGMLTWAWLFIPDVNLGLGSRKEDLVDRLSDRSTLFEKVRMVIRWLPQDLFWPAGFNEKDHMPYMRIINPSNGSTIMGEAGRNIGRGGRYFAYVVDEEDFLEDQEAVDSSLGDATRCRVSVSTYNVNNGLFHRRRKAGLVLPERRDGFLRVFIFDWRDHPNKTQEWYDSRRAQAEREGTLHILAREVDRDPSAAQSNVLIPGLWVSAAVEAHIKLGIEPSGQRIAAMDVADGGGDVNALAVRHGIVLESIVKDGGESDVVGAKYYVKAIMAKADVWRYEVNGVGAGARAGARRIVDANAGNPSARLPAIEAWNPSAAVVNPAGDIHTGETGAGIERRNRDHYSNANSQAWWALRERFRKTYEAVTTGEIEDPDELISLPAGCTELMAELSQPVWGTNGAGKITVDKQPKGTKSPNLADAVKICYAPSRPDQPEPGVGVGMPGGAAGIIVGIA